MIEIKLSQGAKPGHGGVLPGAKVSRRDRATRGVPDGRGLHLAGAPLGLLDAARDDGVHRRAARALAAASRSASSSASAIPGSSSAICKAMLETGIYPDFIVVDGKEGGTGAAPLEFVDHIGMPMREGLMFVHNALVGIGIRERIKIGARGKIITAFDIARTLALGADWCNAARGFMFALGCIQSQSCHTDRCPTGRGDAGPVAPARAGGPRQGRARLQFPPLDAARAGRDHRRRRPRPSQRFPPRSTSPAASTGAAWRRWMRCIPRSRRASCCRARAIPYGGRIGIGRWRKASRPRGAPAPL